MAVVGGDSLLYPMIAGLKYCIVAPEVITSANTPLPGVGSVVIERPASAVNAALLE